MSLPKEVIGKGILNPRPRFPVMHGKRIRSIDWLLVEPHEKQAYANHQQSLKMLASRGGLDPIELWCVVSDMRWRELISLNTPHKELQAIARDCEQKLVDEFGDGLVMK